MEGLKEALQFITELATEAEKTEVLEICGHTYTSNRNLKRCDTTNKADTIWTSTLTSVMDYINARHKEFSGDMILHVFSPTQVRLISGLDADRERETLFVATAETSQFTFDYWYDQERFLIELQANFVGNDDLEAILKVAGNVEAKTTANYGDNGTTQKVTISQGIASKVDVIVPNPAILIPYRTFQEVEQPASKFVFRISGEEKPSFKLIEANGGVWKNDAINNIKQYFKEQLKASVPTVAKMITIIG